MCPTSGREPLNAHVNPRSFLDCGQGFLKVFLASSPRVELPSVSYSIKITDQGVENMLLEGNAKSDGKAGTGRPTAPGFLWPSALLFGISLARPMFHVPRLLLLVLLPLLVVQSASAQPTRTADTFYLRFGQGASDRSGAAGTRTRLGDLWNAERLNGENLQYAFILEGGYRFSPSLSFGVGYQLGSYLHEADVSRRRGGSESLHTVQVLARYKIGARSWVVSPYVDVGINASSGLGRVGVGPTVGGGLSVAVDNQLTLFLESRFNLAYPNQTNDVDFPFSVNGAVAAVEEKTTPFDVLAVLPALGLEFELR